MDHYFSARPKAAHDLRTITYHRGDVDFEFHTDSGVFSKDKVDRGTDLLLEAVSVRDGDRFLDLGCGYGVVGIVVARLCPACRVWMTDVNERACELAEKNAKVNGVHNVKVVSGYGFETLEGLKFDKIAMNPPIRAGKQVIHELIRSSKDHLAPGGEVYVVIRTKQGAASLKRFMEQTFGNAEEPELGSGYRVIRSVAR